MDKHTPSPAQTINYETSVEDHKGMTPKLLGNMTGGALRYDGWQSTFGTVNFGFNWTAIRAGSHVYVSASEVDNAGNRFNGAASFTVQNVVVKEGRVEFRVAINWNSPIRISTDILTIDP
jgi:hypothetical protein